jgi:hypothetical protein
MPAGERARASLTRRIQDKGPTERRSEMVKLHMEGQSQVIAQRQQMQYFRTTGEAVQT